MQLLTVSQVARKIAERTGHAVSPQQISDLFYKRILDDGRCPIVGRSRLIPAGYVSVIERVLAQRDLLPASKSSPSPDGQVDNS